MSESFSDKMKALEKVVKDMESGDISLEDAFALFDKGMKLADECEKKLETYKQKIEIIKKGSEKKKEINGEDE